MCCRYYLDDSPELKPYIDKMSASPLIAKWNLTLAVKSFGEIRPADVVPVIAPNRSGRPSVFPMKWGYAGKQSLLMNARVETAAHKTTFRDDWVSHRCIIPASYYYEWEHLIGNDGKTKTGKKFAIQPKGSSVTWLCGLYRFENDMPVFVILTRDASEEIRFIHDRMPLIMPDNLVNEWIRPDANPALLLEKAICEMVAETA